MKLKFLHVASLFLLMLITGVFWGTWFTLTRSIETFSAEEFIHIGKVIIANVAVPMSIIMPLGILFMLWSLLVYRRNRSGDFYIGTLAFILLIAVLLMTLIVLVPIDNQIKTWTASSVPSNWEDIRTKWKFFHTMRTFASLASFVCFSWFVLSEKAFNGSAD